MSSRKALEQPGSSPVMWGLLGHLPAVVGGVSDQAPQQRGLVHQLLGDATDIHTGAAKAPLGAWYVQKSTFRFIFRRLWRLSCSSTV